MCCEPAAKSTSSSSTPTTTAGTMQRTNYMEQSINELIGMCSTLRTGNICFYKYMAHEIRSN